MDTNETIRDQVARLVDLGVSQAALAKRMGINPSWFSRWINQKGQTHVISVASLDKFAAYLADLAAAIQQAGDTAAEAHAQIARAADAKTASHRDPMKPANER